MKDSGARGAVAAAAFTSAAMIAHQVAGKATRDGLFLSSFPVTALPAVLVGTAALSAAAALGAGRLLRQLGPGRTAPAGFAASAALFLVAWAIGRLSDRAAALATYALVAAFGPVLISAFWSLVTERFDPRAAKRTIGHIAAFGTLGGVIGGVLADRVAHLAGALTMLPVLAALHAACAVAVARVPSPQASAAAADEDASGDSALVLLARVPYLRQLGILVLLGGAAAAMLDYAFKARAVAAISGEAQLVRLFSIFHTGTALVTFAVQAAFGRIALERAGLARTAALLPASIAAGATAAAALPGLASALAARGVEYVLRHSLFRSAYELMFAPMPAMEKRATKALLDVGFERAGDASGGALVALLLAATRSRGPEPVLWVAAAIGAVGVAIALRLRRGYVAALERSLFAGAGRLDSDARPVEGLVREVLPAGEPPRLAGDPADPSVLVTQRIDAETLRAALGARGGPAPPPSTAAASPREASPASRAVGASRPSSEPKSEIAMLVDRITALREPGRHESRASSATVVAQAIPLLAERAQAGVLLKALEPLAAAHAGLLGDALLDPRLALAARRRLARLLGVAGGARAAESLLHGLADERFAIRHACGQALARMRAAAPEQHFDRDRIFGLVHREVDVERRVWRSQREIERLEEAGSPVIDDYLRARASASLEHVFNLLSLVLPQRALQIAFRGLHGADTMLRGTALEYLESVLPAPIREKLWPFLEEDAHRPPTQRGREEILADMMRSHDSIRLRLSELQIPAPADEGGKAP